MAVTTAIVRAAANLALGTQDFTVAGFGTCKAAIFIMTRAIADDVAADGADFSYGATDGISQFSVTATSEDGQASSDTNKSISVTVCAKLLLPGTVNVDGAASFDSFITDGVRIDWINTLASASLLTVILLGGDDLSAFVGSQLLGDVQDTVHTVNNVGFESHLVLAALSDAENIASPTGSGYEYSVGAIHNDASGGVTPRSYIINDQNNQATTIINLYFSTLYGGGKILAGGAFDWGAEFSNFNATGFDITERNAGANNTLIFYLCLRGASPDDFAVGTYSTPTGLGENSETGPDFKPQLVMLGMTHAPSVDTGVSDENAGTVGVAAFTDTAEFANSNSMEDDSVGTNTQSLSAARAIESPLDDGLTGISADFVSMDTLGYTLDYSSVLAAARQFWYAAIKAEPSGQGDVFTEHPWTVPTMYYLPYWKHR